MLQKILRTIATLLVAGMLMVLLISDNFVKDEPVYSGQIQLSPAPISMNMRMLREDVFTVLLTDVDVQTDPPRPRMLVLMVVKPEGIECITLPANTRTLIQHLDGEGLCTGTEYSVLADAYVLGMPYGRGMENLMDAVSQLMGGIPVDRCVAVSSEGLMALSDALGGIQVSSAYHNVVSGSLLGSASIIGEGAMLYGADLYRYAMPNALVGLDTAALSRQQELFVSFLRYTMAFRSADSLTWLEEMTGNQMWYTLGSQDIQAIESILRSVDAAQIPNTILWGEGRKIDDVDYLIPDGVQIKEFVLDNFYE